MNSRSLLGIWLRQQAELGMPDPFIDPALLENLQQSTPLRPPAAEKKITHEKAAGAVPAVPPKMAGSVPRPPAAPRTSLDIKGRLSALRPLEHLVQPVASGATKVPEPVSPISDKREALKALYLAGCTSCHLAQTRKKFVFGAGSAEAPVMVIGEAPGKEEDEQGLPFVGAAGRLLTTMLAAIGLDRSKDVFITNVLKCRPPGNRNPEAAEIITCIPMLRRQIEIIAPKAILLLGRIAAHALLDMNDSIAKMRSRVLSYNTIPVMVIYHPAALLRNAEYKRPAWEDLRQFKSLLATMDIYGSLSKE